MYKKRLIELGAHAPNRVHTTKLKNRIMAHFENIRDFKEGNSSYLVFDADIGSAIKSVCDTDYDDEAFILSKAASILRRDIFSKENKEFDGNFTKNCLHDSLPQSLKSFVGMTLQGTDIKHKYLEQSVLTVSQLLMFNSIKRQRKSTTSQYHSQLRETPLAIYLGMALHAKTRKKGIIDRMNELGLSISYNRVLALSTVMGNSVCTQYETDQVVCPPSLKKNVFTTSALDNIDHNPNSTTAEGSLHGTGISLFQHPTSSQHGVNREKLCIDLCSTKILRLLPEIYTNVRPVNAFNKEPDMSSQHRTIYIG